MRPSILAFVSRSISFKKMGPDSARRSFQGVLNQSMIRGAQQPPFLRVQTTPELKDAGRLSSCEIIRSPRSPTRFILWDEADSDVLGVFFLKKGICCLEISSNDLSKKFSAHIQADW